MPNWNFWSVGAINGGGKVNLIMLLYYAICLFLTIILIINFLKEKNSTNDIILYILVLFPLILRLLRVK